MEIPAIEGGKPVREKFKEYYPTFTEREKSLVLDALSSGRLVYSSGSYVKRFEEEFARYVGVRHAVATINGTAALHTAVASLGIGPGDEVITTPFSFVATATAILHHNAIPVFGDIELESLNLDPETIVDKITSRTKAILVVHLAGYPAEMDEILKIAREHGLYVIEDCAQAIGSEYRGRKVGGIGDVGAFSFYQTKNMTTGEGGMVTTNRDDVYAYARMFVDQGQEAKYYHSILGWNYRMTELQGALGLGQLERVDQLNENRARIAKVYLDELQGLDGDLVLLPKVRPYVKHTWHIFQVLLNLEKLRVDRDRVLEALRAENVLALVAYPRVIYENPLFQRMIGYGKGCPWKCPFYGGSVSYRKGLAPKAEMAARSVITLPTLAGMDEEDAIDTAKALKKVLLYYKR
ncbi:DegT/DnrJ/EryC1/StrS family aminotransferase [Thermofilum pendens]|uniref:DegT/DnrJ/EryC1/StrS aminotransferase n=1 Tax=Thermofilum pendens (strain DSM 2475 / Hrk 5) TaxID=368408 RepID=A1RWE0_THEPD|nr:DegT/DnrJ/EryC1/StrS family aminotransferase [Thermofilum pendens]ABL77520.1 DegT/DnrJ/EryC1/StrS aminotransferase [Thermofilum pendens Hrk 5]